MNAEHARNLTREALAVVATSNRVQRFLDEARSEIEKAACQCGTHTRYRPAVTTEAKDDSTLFYMIEQLRVAESCWTQDEMNAVKARLAADGYDVEDTKMLHLNITWETRPNVNNLQALVYKAVEDALKQGGAA